MDVWPWNSIHAFDGLSVWAHMQLCLLNKELFSIYLNSYFLEFANFFLPGRDSNINKLVNGLEPPISLKLIDTYFHTRSASRTQI